MIVSWQRVSNSGVLSQLIGGLAVVVALVAELPPTRAQQPIDADRNVATHTPTDITDLRRLEQVSQAAMAKALPAVVAVGLQAGTGSPEHEGYDRRFASGILIREDGLILSQYHVSHTGAYDDATGLTSYRAPGDQVDVVLSNGRLLQAELLGGERLADVSLLRLLEPGPYPSVTLATNPAILGEWVLKLGHPRGYQPARGVVSRLGRVVYVNPANIVPDCLTTGGDSGGPLINMDGEIVGLLQDSFMPRHISELASNRGVPMSYMPAAKIKQKMGSMLAGVVPHETTFADHDERKRRYAEILESLPIEAGRSGLSMLEAWKTVPGQMRGSVVEILNHERNRAVYGTVVGQAGLIVTKASAIPQYPLCRLPDERIIAARTVGIDPSLDMALLNVNADDLEPVKWNDEDAIQRNALVMARQINSRPLAVGIVSVPLHGDAFSVTPEGRLKPANFPQVFEHDMHLYPNQHGGPVFDLTGRAIGITIAEGGMHGCLGIAARDIILSIKRLIASDAG